jgi:hypothetical protein
MRRVRRNKRILWPWACNQENKRVTWRSHIAVGTPASSRFAVLSKIAAWLIHEWGRCFWTAGIQLDLDTAGKTTAGGVSRGDTNGQVVRIARRQASITCTGTIGKCPGDRPPARSQAGKPKAIPSSSIVKGRMPKPDLKYEVGWKTPPNNAPGGNTLSRVNASLGRTLLHTGSGFIPWLNTWTRFLQSRVLTGSEGKSWEPNRVMNDVGPPKLRCCKQSRAGPEGLRRPYKPPSFRRNIPFLWSIMVEPIRFPSGQHHIKLPQKLLPHTRVQTRIHIQSTRE